MPKLFLIPNTLGENNFEFIFPDKNRKTISSLNYFFVENIKESRRFIKRYIPDSIIDDLTFIPIAKKSSEIEVIEMIKFLKEKNINAGIISDAGQPGIADPGSDIVSLGHQNHFKIVPLIGPSSFFLALMSSGFNGQSFKFSGYLPKDRNQRKAFFKTMEKEVNRDNCTQMFMDTPFRNNHVFEDLTSTLNPSTMLCIAAEITTSSEFIKTKCISDWKKEKKLDLNKKPCVFIIGNKQ